MSNCVFFSGTVCSRGIGWMELAELNMHIQNKYIR
jgi:hypothetical protein